MAISKRTRFEVLRRDSHTCRYCGATAPDVKLHVDHVTPTALGGTDDPGNLVAACVDCNNGKGSTGPSEQLVADVSDDAARWARAVEQAAEETFGVSSEIESAIDAFEYAWFHYTAWHGDVHARPGTWREVVAGYRCAGLPEDQIVSAVYAAMEARKVNSGDKFRYFCGICKKRIGKLHEAAREIINGGGV